MQRGIVTMNWWQLYLQPRIPYCLCNTLHAAKLQAEQVYKGHRDMRVCVCGVCHSAATGNLMRVPQSGGLVYVTSSGMF